MLAADVTDGFGEARPIMVVTPDDRLAATLFAALDQLAWPFMRAGSLREAERLCGLHLYELLLVDVRLGSAAADQTARLPKEVRGQVNADTPWLPVARVDDWHRADAILCYDGGGDATAIAEFIAAELDRAAESRVLSTARLLVAGPKDLTALPVPPALDAAVRLDRMNANAPSLENAVAVVASHEHLAKQVVRLAHALSGDPDMSSWELRRVLLHLGLLRFVPLVKIVAARSLFSVRDPGRRQILDQIWRFSVARASAMRWMAPRMQTTDLDATWHLAFDAGLFADAGGALLVWLMDQSEPRRLRPRTRNPLTPQLAGQHGWLGERLLRGWGLRSAIAAAANGHHDPSDVDGEETALARLCRTAGAFVEAAGIAVDPTGSHGGGHAEQARTDPALSLADQQQIINAIKVQLDRIDEF
jgi:hypothetical protein